MFLRDIVAFPPALHCRVIAVAERPRDGPDAPALPNDLCVLHTQDIRTRVRPVNVETVSSFCETLYVSEGPTTGAKLKALRERSGLSLRALAIKAGYSQASSIQRYFDDAYEAQWLPLDVAHKLAAGFDGTNVSRGEVFELTGVDPETNARPVRIETVPADPMTRDVPIYGTALGADEIVDGEAIEQTYLNTSEIIGYLRRPPILVGRQDIYALYVQGMSMSPRFRDGATLFVEKLRPVRVGDDVVVYLRAPDEHEGERPSGVLVKTLVRKTASYIELEQYAPAITFRLPVERVARMDRVIPWDELVA